MSKCLLDEDRALYSHKLQKDFPHKMVNKKYRIIFSNNLLLIDPDSFFDIPIKEILLMKSKELNLIVFVCPSIGIDSSHIFV
jgi:hypothetical protein